MPWKIEHLAGSLYLPQIELWCDAHIPTPCSFVSHAHFDHLAAHRKIIVSEGTRRLMAERLPGEREEIVLPYDVSYPFTPETELRLYPAGHIYGSAMLHLTCEDETFLYTGDFKLRPGKSAEPCQPPRADVLVMETTFGLPRYIFPPTEQTLAEIIKFCHLALEDGEVPVLFGYSLGKSQELLSSLAGAALPIMLHPQTLKITRVYEELGLSFPAYRPFVLEEVAGHVVVCPPQANQSSWLRKITPRRTAAVTGWAMDPVAIFRYQCDAAFPLSDHADYADLLEFVERVQPKRVLTVHGYTQEFARVLRERGIEAWALGIDNQLEMVWRGQVTVSPSVKPQNSAHPSEDVLSRPDDLLAFAGVAEEIRATPRKLEKIAALRRFFQALPDEALISAALAFTGRAFPASTGQTLQCGWAILKAALLEVAGMTEADYRATYQRYSDSGDTAEAVLTGQTEAQSWPLAALPEFFSHLRAARGPLEKRMVLQERLARLHPRAAKYLVKIITGDLRIGLKEGLVEEALAEAFGQSVESVREANMLSGDLAATARAAKADELATVALTWFHPIHPMLASPEPTAEALVERLGAAKNGSSSASEIWLEEKYDGIRCQVHKQDERVELYSRELRRITEQFPELIPEVRKIPADFIADAELLAWQNGRALPFTELQKRLGRKAQGQGDDLFLGAEAPVSLWLFDLLGLAGESWLKRPLTERRAELEKLPNESKAMRVEIVPLQRVLTAGEIEVAFQQARQRGNEGLMAKDPHSFYTPGRRGLAWLKLKKAYATLDVVVVGVEWGHGKRKHVLSDYTFAVRDEQTDELLPIGKAYSGLTDVEIARYTEHFLQTTRAEEGRYRTVEPEVILEVAFDTIQTSDRHASGYALRFPRILRIREDKTIREIDTLEHCQKLAEAAALGF